MSLIHSRGLEAIKKMGVGMDKAALELAKVVKEAGAETAETTLGFIGEEDECDGEFIVNLTIKVTRV